MKDAGKILVLRGGAVGDFILTLPAIVALREQYPHARLELAAYPRVARLVLETGVVDAFISLDSAEIASLFSPGTESRQRLIGFDLIVSYLRDTDGIVRSNLERTGCARVITADPLPAAGTHAADHLASILSEAGISAPYPAIPRLNLFSVKRAAGNRMIIHPGSGGSWKNWSASGFVELARIAAEQLQAEPVFTFGEADAVVREEIVSRYPDVRILPECDLYELAIELASCRGYVGNDSGITHLAATAGAGVVALFGPTDPAVWGPRGNNVRVLQFDEADGLSSLPPERVFAAVQELWCGD
jgi:ADP-heptose:LPS heptosyltransferase